MGPGRSGRADRAGWTEVAEGVVIDTTFWGARADGVAALERELARLRRVQTAHARELVRPIARASVLNLIVFADREEHARRAARRGPAPPRGPNRLRPRPPSSRAGDRRSRRPRSATSGGRTTYRDVLPASDTR